MTRRTLLLAPGAALAGGIDRHAVVRRHNSVLRALDTQSPLSVGNGEFAFTADITGLQTFAGLYEQTIPLCTQSQWGWHSFPIPDGLSPDGLRLEMFETYGRQVGYATRDKGQAPLFNWLRENPHRLNLARIGLLIDGRQPKLSDLSGIEQKLDLWTGVLESRFELLGERMVVLTACHPDRDALAVSITSPLVTGGRLAVAFEFPYGSTGMNASDWTSSERHQTRVLQDAPGAAGVELVLDADRYHVRLQWDGNAGLRQQSDHRLILSGGRLEFVAEFGHQKPQEQHLAASQVLSDSASYWTRFWSNGGAVDFSGSTDPRAQELERRVVLSQYLTAIQCAGSAPSQETGLTCNSWYGKFHLEMHWWHAAHFALWGRTALLERSLGWYSSILPVARAKAKRQGYRGARWPKMTALDGRDSPSAVGEMLIWQQPHPIMMAEHCYRSHPDRATLQRYRDVVMESAEFMASFAVERDGRYVLGPPLIPAQENHPPRETWNPTFELAYWRQALGTAQMWRERLGLARNGHWDDVRKRLSQLPVKDGVYLAHENCPQTFAERNRDHPSMLGAFGVLDGEGVDRQTMSRTLHRVLKDWRWADTWGWDFPMVAMTAARLGEPELAVDALFIDSPKNTWLKNGHNWQRANLPVYLPGNGGLLAAVAMMATTWQGFPRKGWRVRAEGLRPLL